MTTPVQGPPRVVVGVDGSQGSKQALRWAAYVAASAQARVEAVAAWEFPLGYGWGTVPQEWSPAQDTQTNLADTVDEVFGAARPADMRLIVLEGNAARILLEQSQRALLLVVGSRGHGGFAGLLLGSVSASVAEHAACPVLVIHGGQNPPTT
jgi:nucleotide-binding universal stress UspA family protein